jgi:hypothetical protein
MTTMKNVAPDFSNRPNATANAYCASPTATDDHIGFVLVEIGLSDSESVIEVVVGQLGIENGVAVLRQEGWLDATWD